MKVVRWRNDSASGICQNQLLALGLLNMRAPIGCPGTFSTVGRGWTQSTLTLSGFRSTQMHTDLSGLGTVTIPTTHHSVGSFTLEITPSDTIVPALP